MGRKEYPASELLDKGQTVQPPLETDTHTHRERERERVYLPEGRMKQTKQRSRPNQQQL